MFGRSISSSLLAATITFAPTLVAQEREAMARLGVQNVSVQSLTTPATLPGVFEVAVVLGGVPRVLDLVPYDVRDAGHRVLVDDGVSLSVAPKLPSITYRGTVRGTTNSFVAASWLDGSIEAHIRIDSDANTTGSYFVIEPLSRVLPATARSRAAHVVYASSDNLARNRLCGVTTPPIADVDQRSRTVRPQATVLAQLACDADYEFYKLSGSSTSATVQRITTLVNAVDAIFKQDIDVTIKISTTIVRTTSTYTSIDPRILVTEVQKQWNTSHGNVQRDLVHAFSGKASTNGILGYGILGSVCTLSDAYSVSMPNDANASRNVGLIAHELGHNFDALHCDAETSCNIMCSRLGGCSANLAAFAALSKATMIKFRDTRTCLDSATPPQLTSVTPTSLTPFGAPTITVVGQRLRSVNEVVIGVQRIDVSTAAKSDTTFSFRLPPPPALGTFGMTVVSPAGPSNAIQVTLRASQPPELAVTGFVLSGFPLLFEFAGRERATWILLVAPSGTTFRFGGYDILQNFVPLAAGPLDAAGLGNFTATIPQGVRGTIWSQIVTDNGGMFDAASAIRMTSIF